MTMISHFEEITSFIHYISEVLKKDKVLTESNVSVDMASTWGDEAAITFLSYFKNHSPKKFKNSLVLKNSVTIKDLYDVLSHEEKDLVKVNQVFVIAMDTFGWPPSVIEDVLNCKDGNVAVFIRSRTFDMISLDDEIEDVWEQKKWNTPRFLEEVLVNHTLKLDFKGITPNVFHKAFSNNEKLSENQKKSILDHRRCSPQILKKHIHSMIKSSSKMTPMLESMILKVCVNYSKEFEEIFKILSTKEYKSSELKRHISDILKDKKTILEYFSRLDESSETQYLLYVTKYENVYPYPKHVTKQMKIYSKPAFNRLIKEIKKTNEVFAQDLSITHADSLLGENLKHVIRTFRRRRQKNSLTPAQEAVYRKLKTQAFNQGMKLMGMWG